MNCCDTYGSCRQGRDCPARTGVVLPYQAEHAKRTEANECAAEGGNVWLVGDEPVDDAVWKSIVVYVALTFGVLCTVAIFAAAIGWAWTTFFGG